MTLLREREVPVWGAKGMLFPPASIAAEVIGV